MEALPSPALKLDIDLLEARLAEAGWQPKVNATVLLIVRKEHEVSIYANGKTVIKNPDLRVAEQVWDELAPHIMAVHAA
jgi:hypothetical protein